MKTSDYIKEFGEVKRNFAERFEIPRQLTVYNQYDSNDCTGFATATAAEIIFGKRMSAGWYMMQSKAEGQKGDGRFIQKVLEAACNVGGVPLADFGVLGENADVLETVKNNAQLLAIAERYKFDGVCSLLYADRKKRDMCIKDAVMRYDEGVAVIATSNRYFGQNHCICIVGYDDKKDRYIFQNSEGKAYGNNGRSEIPKDKLDTVYAVFKRDISLPFKDIEPNGWSYEDIKVAYDAGIIKGASETEFVPGRGVTREEVGAMLGRLVRMLNEREERNILLNHQGEV